MFRLAAVYLSELRFGEFGYFKDGSQSCLARSDRQVLVTLQSIKNRVHNVIISCYALDPGNVTSLFCKFQRVFFF